MIELIKTVIKKTMKMESLTCIATLTVMVGFATQTINSNIFEYVTLSTLLFVHFLTLKSKTVKIKQTKNVVLTA